MWWGEFDAPLDMVVTLPPIVPPSWRNISDEPGRMFAIVTPGGREQLYIDIVATGAKTAEATAVIERPLGIINEATEALGQPLQPEHDDGGQGAS